MNGSGPGARVPSPGGRVSSPNGRIPSPGGGVPSPYKLSGNERKLHRNHTDAAVYKANRLLDADAIIEDDDGTTAAPLLTKVKPTKKHVLVARHKTDILTKRPPSAPVSFHSDGDDIKVTRRSVSRQGSRIQQGSRMQIIDEAEYTTSNVLKSQIQSDKKVSKLGEMIGYSRKVLICHREKTKSCGTERKSRAFHAAMQIVQSQRTVLISGKLGSGKSHTALDIMQCLLETQTNYLPVIARSPYELNVLENTSTEAIVLVDDCLGVLDSDGSKMGGWRRMEALSKTLIERKQVYFILTTDNSVFETAMDVENGPGIPFIRDISRIDIESDAFRLTTMEQVHLLPLICKNQQKLNAMKDTLFEQCSKFDNQQIGFPLVCNLIGVTETEYLFMDTFRCLCEFVADLRENNIACYMLLLLILFYEEGVPIAGLSSTKKTTIQKLLAIFNVPKCSYADVIDSVDNLIESNLIVKDADKVYLKFSHRLVYMAVLKDLTHCKFDEVLDLLPVNAVNFIQFKVPNMDKAELDDTIAQSDTTDIKILINMSQSHCNIIASKFSTVLESKKPEAFTEVAASKLWSNKQFMAAVQCVIGFHLFFIDDEFKVPLSVYLIRCGRSDVLIDVYAMLTQTHGSLASGIQQQLARTIEEAIRDRNKSLLTRYSKLYSGNDIRIVQAAIETGNLEIIEIVLNPAGPYHNSISDMVPLACACDSLDTVKYLLTQLHHDVAGALLRKNDTEGRTLLHFVAKGGSVEMFDFLVDLGLDIRAQTRLEMTMLDIAAMHGKTKLVKHICSLVPDMIEMTDSHGFTVAHFAAREGQLDIVQHVVTNGAEATLKVQGGNTIFHLAAFNGHVSVLNFLIDSYPGLQTLQNEESFLPIHLAAKRGQIEMIDFFMKIGTDPKIQTIDGRTLLHIAAFHGHLNLVQYLSCRFQEICKIVDRDGNTVAHDASASGNIAVLKYFIENHIDPLFISGDGCTLLHEACYYSRTEVVKYLVTSFPKMINVRSSNGYSSCHASALGGCVDILDVLIHNGADPLALSEDGSTILHEAAFSGKIDMIKYITANCPDMLSIENVRSYIPCHFAAQEGHLDILKHLISVSGSDIPKTHENQTLLHIAAYNGRLNIVKYICGTFTDMVCKKDINGATAIHYAARGGFNEVLDFLLLKGLDPCAVTTSDSTLLHLAAYDGKIDTVKRLCSTYPQLIQMLDDTGNNAAHHGAGSGNLDLLQFLLEQGIDPMSQTSNGSTLLLKAAFAGKMKSVQYLCSNYTDMLYLSDEFGCNALHYSACGGHVDVLQYLCTQGLDPMTKTKDGHTLLHVAAYHGQMPIVLFLCQEYPDLRNVTDGEGQTAEKLAQLGEQTDILKYLKKDKRPGGVAQTVVERLPACGTGCCKSVRSIFSRTWGGCLGLICFCRHG